MTAAKVYFYCRLCGSPRADITRKEDGSLYVGCFSCDADGVPRGDWARETATAVGAPGGGALLADPWHWLGAYAVGGESIVSGRNGGSRRGAAPLPSLGSIYGWRDALLADREPLYYLVNGRGLKIKTLTKRRIGYAVDGAPGVYADCPAFTFPVFGPDGSLVNLIKRFWPSLPAPDAPRYVVLPGTSAQLYPGVPKRGRLGVDALLGLTT